ncbi:Na/Pi cotransporter family protein [Hespellia stercorisuis]|uniref:Phosphate:Na+ symporter n=1 Tax=Hespellia stercorisuis DSM 15480 TaxID=1121950 RepID=A0A1M6HPS6_9FIRM|nr:Na/Pi cotransporter family protein [Hespellia stercorisuis]SHJ24146.1 phosphate:Na+ symporter [Hespellia stercorisuis DSM 15480]
MGITTIFLLLGGLGLFLFGMKLMSDGLEQVAGAKMRSILEFFTKNRFVGMLVGILFTAIVQSSSATTVMVVSFVNSGLMSLLQAAGVILGANIGTTVTGQLIAFNLSDIAPLFVIVGVVMLMFSKKVNIRKIGGVVLGFGILFMGLSTMSDAMSGLKDSPHMLELLRSLTNPMLAILVGFAITAVLQSSSATVGIVILMANQGLLAFTICPFLILGCNMGSCVSALIASLGGKKDAKRAAWIHFLFNIMGSFVIFIVLMLALTPITDTILRISGGNVGRAVANAHTLIKVLEVVMLFPFMNWIVKLTYVVVPGTDPSPEDQYELKYIGEGTMLTPTTATIDAIHEIEHMAMVAKENLELGMDALCTLDQEKIEQVYEQEAYVNFLNRKITKYLVRINELELPLADAAMTGGLFHVVNDIERIGDHAENLADSAKSRINNDINFSEKAVKQLKDMTVMVSTSLEYAIELFTQKSQEHMQEIIALEDAIDMREKKLQQSHIKRLTKGRCTPEAGMIFSDTVSGLERVADHATNIAFAIYEPSGNELTDDDDDDVEDTPLEQSIREKKLKAKGNKDGREKDSKEKKAKK